jgi:hypothetical protein
VDRPWLRASIAVLGGLLLAVPLLVAREFGWYVSGGRKLEDPATRAQVTVVALDALTDGPLQGVRTWGEGAFASARTDEAGAARLDMETGVTVLVAGGRGRAMAGRPLELAPGPAPVQVFRLLEVETLSGQVELPDGGPAVGASVSAAPLQWPALPVAVPDTDEEGGFLVPRAGPGTYRLEATLAGEGRAVALVRAPDDQVVLQLSAAALPELPGGEEPAGETLPARADGPVVTVRGPDGGTVPGALVLAAPADGGAPGVALRRGQLRALCATDLEGRCRVPAGTGCMLATAVPHADSEPACAGGTLLLRPGLGLSGQAPTGTAGGWVSAGSGPLSAVDRDGGFLLRGLPPGTEALTLHDARGDRVDSASVTLPMEGAWDWPPRGAPLQDGGTP